MGSFYYVVVILEPKSPTVNLNCTNPLKPTPRNNKKPYPSNMSKLLFLPLPIYHDRKTYYFSLTILSIVSNLSFAKSMANVGMMPINSIIVVLIFTLLKHQPTSPLPMHYQHKLDCGLYSVSPSYSLISLFIKIMKVPMTLR